MAAALEIRVDAGTIVADGDLDFRGALGIDRTAPVGFSEDRFRFDPTAPDADDEQLATLLKLTERNCVVLQTLRGAPTVTAAIAAG